MDNRKRKERTKTNSVNLVVESTVTRNYFPSMDASPGEMTINISGPGGVTSTVVKRKRQSTNIVIPTIEEVFGSISKPPKNHEEIVHLDELEKVEKTEKQARPLIPTSKTKSGPKTSLPTKIRKVEKAYSTSEMFIDSDKKLICTPEDKDKTYRFYPYYFSKDKAHAFFTAFMRDCDFQQGKVQMFDRQTKKKIWMDERRLVAYHGNMDYTYSGKTMPKKPMSATMEFLLDEVEKMVGKRPGGVIFNLYQTGNDYISYHADKEDTLAQNMPIFSFSFGATRDFCIKFQRPEDGVAHGLEESVSLHQYKKFVLESGSLFIMFPGFQKMYLHGVPKRMNCKEPRINATVRFLKQ